MYVIAVNRFNTAEFEKQCNLEYIL